MYKNELYEKLKHAQRLTLDAEMRPVSDALALLESQPNTPAIRMRIVKLRTVKQHLDLAYQEVSNVISSL